MGIDLISREQQGLASDLLARKMAYKSGTPIATMFGREAAAWGWYEGWVAAQQLMWIPVSLKKKQSKGDAPQKYTGPVVPNGSKAPVFIAYKDSRGAIKTMPALFLKGVPLEFMVDEDHGIIKSVTGYYYQNMDADLGESYFEITEEIVAYMLVPMYKPNETLLYRKGK